MARVFGAVAVVVDGLYVARGWGRRRGKKKKKRPLESPGNISLKKNGNYKEILKNNILIKIEFWDAGGIVKWYGIMIKWIFGMVK